MYKATSQRVKKGLLQMVIGRPLSAICGLLVLIFLSRYLTKNDYGLYFTVWAVTELVILASNLGLFNAAYRYISSKELTSGGLLVEGPVWHFTILRFIFLSMAAVVVAKLSIYIPDELINRSAINKYGIYLSAIIIAEGMARYIETLFDSMLCQGMSQFTLIGRTCLRLLLLLWAIYISKKVDIDAVLTIEVVVTATGAVTSLVLLLYIYVRSYILYKRDTTIEAQPFPAVSRVMKFVLPAYLAQMIALAYSPDMLKLILGGAAGYEALAIFGFAFSLAAVVQRYMPANLLGGIFRPSFVAASKSDDGGKTLGVILSLSMKANVIFVLPAVAFCYFGADALLSVVSDGNYTNIGSVLTVLLLWALALSLHMTMAMYCIALEYTYPTFIAAIISTISLPIGVITAKYGAISMAGVILLSEILWFISCYCIIHYRSAIQINHISFLKMIFSVVLAISITSAFAMFTFHWLVLSVISSVLCIGLLYKIDVFDQAEREWLNERFPKLEKWV